MGAFFNIPLNLPHAGTVAARIVALLKRQADEAPMALKYAQQLEEMLAAARDDGENPVAKKAEAMRQSCARMGREMVREIAASNVGSDRAGQCVRNFFECLEMGEEGADLGLKAGENPASAQRPV